MKDINSSEKICPNCGQMNPSTATICDCRYNFETGTLEAIQKTWKPIIAGILSFAAGILYFVISFGIWAYYASCASSDESTPYLFMISLAGVFGVLAIVGGRYALKRKKWRVALLGTAFSLLGGISIMVYMHLGGSGAIWLYDIVLVLLFFPPIILAFLSKDEFE